MAIQFGTLSIFSPYTGRKYDVFALKNLYNVELMPENPFL